MSDIEIKLLEERINKVSMEVSELRTRVYSNHNGERISGICTRLQLVEQVLSEIKGDIKAIVTHQIENASKHTGRRVADNSSYKYILWSVIFVGVSFWLSVVTAILYIVGGVDMIGQAIKAMFKLI